MTTWVNQFKDSGDTWKAGQLGILAGEVFNQPEITLYAGQIGIGIDYTNQTRT